MSDDRIPDVRDGLTREQRVVLYYISPERLSELLAQIGARKS